MKGLEFMVDELILSPTFGRVFYNLLHMGFEHEDIRKALMDMYRHYHAELTRVFQTDGAGEDSSSLAIVLQALVEGFSIIKAIDPDLLDRNRVTCLLRRTIESVYSK